MDRSLCPRNKEVFRFSNFSSFLFFNDICLRKLQHVFNCNFFIYLFISRSIIKANEVDSKNVNINVNFLCNLQNAKKPPLCKPSLKWSLKKKMIKSNIISSKQVIPHHTKLNENFKKKFCFRFCRHY